MVEMDDLVVGKAYYMVGFADTTGKAHLFDTIIFMGVDLIGEAAEEKRLYFKFSEDFNNSDDVEGAFWFDKSHLFTIYDLEGLHNYIGTLIN